MLTTFIILMPITPCTIIVMMAVFPRLGEAQREDSRVNSLETTHMNTQVTDNHIIADLGIDDNPFENPNNLAFYSCEEWENSLECYHAHIIYNRNLTGMPYNRRRAVACHEVGHSVGCNTPTTVACLRSFRLALVPTMARTTSLISMTVIDDQAEDCAMNTEQTRRDRLLGH